ncbi:MAG: hypothetical protein MNPFHGCM_01898 [Gemmatimonadaceae bacterium]|nr:hypothetical protein [Gemmatimonadaceae bacterium]
MRFPLATRYTDYDTKGHVNNAVYLTYFEMARHALWHEHWGRESDPPFIVAEARVKYVSPAYIGESLVVDIAVAEIRTKAWVYRYEIREEGGNRLVAEGATVQVAFDYGARSTLPISADVRALLETVRA